MCKSSGISQTEWYREGDEHIFSRKDMEENIPLIMDKDVVYAKSRFTN